MLKQLSLKSSYELGERGLVTFLNPYSYLLARKHKQVFQRFNSILVDGIMLVIILRLFGIACNKRRSFDMTSMADEVFKYAEQEGKSVYFLGSEERFIKEAVHRIAHKYPAMVIKGFRNGFFNDHHERTAALQKILAASPDIVIVGMGTPLQEEFLVDLRDCGWNGSGFTCGGFFHQTAKALDYYPSWINTMQLRWLYRIIDEPKLFKRYFIQYPLFLLIFIADFVLFKMKVNR